MELKFLSPSLQYGLGNPMIGMSTIVLTAYGVVIAVSLFAASESIAVAIDNEYNTRLTAHLLEKLLERIEK